MQNGIFIRPAATICDQPLMGLPERDRLDAGLVPGLAFPQRLFAHAVQRLPAA